MQRGAIAYALPCMCDQRHRHQINFHSIRGWPSGNSAAPPVGEDLTVLAGLLGRLPVVWPTQPLHWVPRALRSMAGQVLCAMLEAAAAALTTEPGDHAAWVATLLCRNAGMLLLRSPPLQTDDEATAGSATAVIRKRLLLATAGDWRTLVQEALDELEAERRQPPPSRPPPDLPDPNQPLSDEVLARAAAKARLGGIRSAANILVGGAIGSPRSRHR